MGAVDVVEPILVIDDDADIRDSLAEILSDEGYAVRCFANGAEALEHLQHDGKASLIILDLMMPGMNGWAFREVQSHDERLAAIPVIAVSAVADLEPPWPGAPTTTLMCKPVNLDQLLERVAAQVHHGRGKCGCIRPPRGHNRLDGRYHHGKARW
jgi:CheY-like chemotaxis protein